jgi:hypothetical protein
MQEHIGARPVQRACDGRADAAGGSRDEHGLARKRFKRLLRHGLQL